MKKSIKIILISVLSLVVVIEAVLTVAYFNPKIEYGILTPVDENTESYAENITVTYKTKFNLPLDNKSNEFIEDFYNKISAYNDDVNSYESPRQVKATAECENGKTVFNFTGYVTKDGKQTPYEYSFEIDRELSQVS